ncbi:PREDICTED: uncharacterized protein LOC109465205 [Branchiostoma belcheri]|uniref:Uncharacterized protein LOC109465205 n=1 Tax=Branchiostoma belcheri TaxID=7741 RepID=A0A6P4XMQ3_BRABE|nr:PREDICTED: uncharacterized protein LOC109465205 [Branchiostoma belcheri]
MASSNMASGRSMTSARFCVFLVTLVVTMGVVKTTAVRCPEVCDCTPDVGGQDVACIGYNLQTIPEGLPEDTVELNIRNNDIEILDLESLKTLSRLEGLDVSSNKIKTIRGTFEDFPKLSQVQLYDNELTTLSPSTFGKAATRMHYVSLFDNPWNCDCNLVWMKREMDSKNYSLSSQLVQCDTPEELHGNYTADIDVDKFVCKQFPGLPLQTVLMSAIIPSAVFVLAVIVATAFYCYRRRDREEPLPAPHPETGPVGSRYDDPLLPGDQNIDDIEQQIANNEYAQNADNDRVVPVPDGGLDCAPIVPDIKTTPTFSFLECVPTTSTITLEWRFQHGRQPKSCELYDGKVWTNRTIQQDHEGRWRTFIDNVKPDTEFSFQVRGIFGGQQGRISEPMTLQTPLTDNLQKECEEGCTARQFLKDFCILGDKTYANWMEKLCKTLEGTWALTGWLLERDAEPGTFKLDNLDYQKKYCKKLILVFGESSDQTMYEELNLKAAVTGFLMDTKRGDEQRLIPIKMSSEVDLPDYMSPLEELTFKNNKYFWSRLITGLTDKHACVFDDGEVKTPNSVSV